MALGTSLTVRRPATVRQIITLPGKAASGGLAGRGAYIVGDPLRAGSGEVSIPMSDVLGNRSLIEALHKHVSAGNLVVADASGAVLSRNRIAELLQYEGPITLGPFFYPGAADLTKPFIVGKADAGHKVLAACTVKYLEVTQKVANTADVEVTVHNITQATSEAVTVAAQAAGQGFARVNLTAVLDFDAGDQLALEFTALTATQEGEDWVVSLGTTEGN